MKPYLLSVCYPADATRPPPEILEGISRDVNAINKEIKAAGAWVFAGGLFPPSTATVVRPKDGEFLLTDGPFIETKEQIGGFAVIRAPDLDAALDWARKFAHAITVPIEVRPIQEHGVT
ncbi:MAG: YciI family protein [Candidatus Dormibacteraceae bacterium]